MDKTIKTTYLADGIYRTILTVSGETKRVFTPWNNKEIAVFESMVLFNYVNDLCNRV